MEIVDHSISHLPEAQDLSIIKEPVDAFCLLFSAPTAPETVSDKAAKVLELLPIKTAIKSFHLHEILVRGISLASFKRALTKRLPGIFERSTILHPIFFILFIEDPFPPSEHKVPKILNHPSTITSLLKTAAMATPHNKETIIPSDRVQTSKTKTEINKREDV